MLESKRRQVYKKAFFLWLKSLQKSAYRQEATKILLKNFGQSIKNSEFMLITKHLKTLLKKAITKNEENFQFLIFYS